MEQSLRERVAQKEYDQITSAKQFATTLTNDLQPAAARQIRISKPALNKRSRDSRKNWQR